MGLAKRVLNAALLVAVAGSVSLAGAAPEPSENCSGTAAGPATIQQTGNSVAICIADVGKVEAAGDQAAQEGHVYADGDSTSPADGYAGVENDNEDTGHQPAVVACRVGDYRNDSDNTVEPNQGNHVVISQDGTVTAPDHVCIDETP